jgi:SAM-dependent methyltransferase
MSTSYEAVRYPGMPFAQTHPDRLAAMGTLFGMNPPPIHQARVLEIGCCDGGNLIPMAVTLPGARFVGIDLTESDIATARETAAALNLPNIEFHALDLTTLPGPLGQFDYVIAHGVYSWVPAAVRERLLGVIQSILTPNGVAYVSYNTLPGGHLRLMLRDMMKFHSRHTKDPARTLSRSRELLEFIAAAPGADDAYRSFMNHEIEAIFNRPDYGLFHDELEENYQPVYFHEFADHAARHGLQYLSEANYFDMQPDDRGLSEAPVFAELGDDPILRDQYIDFARCRVFRQSLLCHREIALDRTAPKERLTQLFLASPAGIISSEDGEVDFRGPNNSRIKTAHPVVLHLMHALMDVWPRAISYRELVPEHADRNEVCEILHGLFGAGLIEARIASPNLATRPGERPLASPLARLQAAGNLPLTTLRHMTIVTGGGIENRLISLLDGTRTRVDLLAELMPLLNPQKTYPEHLSELDISLTALARLGLLIS